MATGDTAPKCVDEYIAAFSPEVQAILERVRLTIGNAAPGALAVRPLDASRSGRSDAVALFLESEVNRGLLMSHQLAASPLSSKLGPVWGFFGAGGTLMYAAVGALVGGGLHIVMRAFRNAF